MAETWLTIEQMRSLMGWSERHARRAAASHGWQQRTIEARGRNGKRAREYALSSLPADAQARFLLQASCSSETAITVRPDAILERAETLPLFVQAQPITEEQRLELRPEDREEADRRLEIIAPLIDFKGRTNGSRPHIRVGGKVVSNLNDLAEWIAAQRQISAKSIWRWFIAWQKDGYPGLASKPRSDAGSSRALGSFEKPTAAGLFLQKKYCAEGLNATHAWEALCRQFPDVSVSAATARRYLAKLPVGIATLGRQGAEAYANRCAPFILRKAPPAMEWWISDHRRHDVFVRNTLFPQLGWEEMYRPWLTAIYDWGSRKLIGFVWSPSPNSGTICSALRAPASELGFPTHFYWDNGKDFKKTKRDLARIDVPAQVGDVLRLTGTQVTSALPKHPRSKPVEAYFVRWSLRFDRIWGAAYAGNKPENCRPQCREAQKQHQEYLKCKRRSSPIPSDAEFVRAAVQWVEEYNSTRLECLDGRTPSEVFEEQFPPECRHPATSAELNKLLSVRCERTILAGGCIEINRMRYEPEEQSLGQLSLQIGKRMTVLRDPYNLGLAVAVDERGYYSGTFQLQQLVEQDPANPITQEQIKAAIRRERALKRSYSNYLEGLAATNAMFGWKTEREALLERALTGTEDSRSFARIAAAAPGARPGLPAPRAPRQLAPAFVSDAVEQDAEFWRQHPVKLED